MLKLLLLLTTLLVASTLAADDGFCGLASCGDREHLDCTMGNGKFGSACVNAVMLNLAPAKAALLKKLNTFRNLVAGGRLTKKFAATRMGTIKWNVTFANLGRRSVKKCNFEQDTCINTPDFDFMGQSIGRSVQPKSSKKTNLVRLIEIFDTWIAENADAKMSDMRRFPQPTADGPVIANFAQLVRDYATRMGCGALKYDDGDNDVILMTCNFDLANVLGWPVYDDGPVGKKCQTGMNPDYPNLCSSAEKYNVNTFFDDEHYDF